MKKVYFALLACGVLFLMSFQPKVNMYLSCGHFASESQNGVPTIELILNQDHTFSYWDRSVSADIKSRTGTWSIDGNIIKLDSDENQKVGPKKWKLTNDMSAISGRTGMAWYRLCKN